MFQKNFHQYRRALLFRSFFFDFLFSFFLPSCLRNPFIFLSSYVLLINSLFLSCFRKTDQYRRTLLFRLFFFDFLFFFFLPSCLRNTFIFLSFYILLINSPFLSCFRKTDQYRRTLLFRSFFFDFLFSFFLPSCLRNPFMFLSFISY